MDKNLKRSMICFAIAAWLLYLLISGGCSHAKFYPGECRHKALYVASILAEHHGEDTVFVEWSDTPVEMGGVTHVQAFVYGRTGSKKYFNMINNSAAEVKKDFNNTATIRVFTLPEYEQMMKKWRQKNVEISFQNR